MNRIFAGLLIASAALSAAACAHTEPGAGSSTNWLRPCGENADCAEGLSCSCGACTETCESDCSSLPDAVCATSGSAAARTQCGGVVEHGLCLPRCSEASECAAGQLCVDDACVELAPPSPRTSGCGVGTSLELVSAGDSLQARYGTLFSDALYLPVDYAERPADWSEPAPPAALTARVTDADGEPIEGCTVRFVTGEGSGIAFAQAQASDASGEVTAHWVAGDARRQSLRAALVQDDASVVTKDLDGRAYANDEGTQSDAAERATTAEPSTVRLDYDLAEETNRFRVLVSPRTFPHHAFYSAIAIDGFFTGLQNTSSVDAATGNVAEVDRALIASVWNLAEGDAVQLFGVPELDCTPHDQGLGGIRCMLPGAWSLGESYAFELERRALVEGESPPEYADIGFSTEPCASSAGCTDYTLYFEGRRLVAYRYQSAEVATSFGSFVQAYADLSEQNSCLATPSYDVTFAPTVQLAGLFAVVGHADFRADYASWQNEVCANYAASAGTDGFRLVTGGPAPLGAPQLPDESPRRLVHP